MDALVDSPLRKSPPTATDAAAPFVDSLYADPNVVLAANDALLSSLVDDMDVDLQVQAVLAELDA